METAKRHDTDSVSVRAIDHWLAGLLFTLVVSTLVVLASYAPLIGRPFRAIEVGGIDAAMQARLWLAPSAPVGREVSAPAPGYVFVDIDSAACLAAEQSQWCVTRSPASPAAAARAAVAILAAQPRVVIIDVRLWDQSSNGRSPAADFHNLVMAAKADPDARIVAAALSRPSPTPGVDLIDASLMPQELISGGIKFAPAYGWSEGGVLRRYPATVTVGVAGSKTPAAPALTMPYLAALYADAGRDPAALSRVDCLAWPAPPTGCAAADGKTDTEKSNEDARPLFTLPSLPAQGPTTSPQAARFWGLYEHYQQSDILAPDGSLSISPKRFEDKVVVIGSSAPDAQDFHVTPIGVMTGAEVLLNVTRAFSANAVLTEPPLLGKLLREGLVATIGSLPFLAFWWASGQISAWIERRAWYRAHRLARPLAFLPAVVLFFPTILASALLMIAFAFTQLNISFLGGRTWDLFTPLAALSLEGFTDASARVLHMVENFVVGVRLRIFPASPPTKTEGGAT